MGSAIKSYRDLIVWQRAIELVMGIYQETSSLPQDERFGLVSQMRRCAIIVPSNIAEGWGRGSKQDYIRFLRTARGSLYELATQAEISLQLEFAGNWKNIWV